MKRPTPVSQIIALVVITFTISACAIHHPLTKVAPLPNLTPDQPVNLGPGIALHPDTIEPMEVEVFAIDLPTVVRVALADSIDVLQAQQTVEAARGQFDAARNSIFPALAPTAVFNATNGRVRATRGNIVDVGFKTFRAFLAIDWVLNPGKTYYEIVAAKKRLMTSEHTERAVAMQTLHNAALQFYDLTLAQGRVANTKAALAEAEELLRVSELHQRAGTGNPADLERARARFAKRSREVVTEMNHFYQASVILALTLRLEPQVTLVPNVDAISPVSLVSENLALEELLGIAATFRPDLQAISMLVKATQADTGAALWGGFGPTFDTGYAIGGIRGFDVDNVSALSHETGFQNSQLLNAGVGLRLDLLTLGNLRTAGAVKEQMKLEALRRLDTVKAQVVSTVQTGRASRKIISLTEQETNAAESARRMINEGFNAGTATALYVLQADEALARARLSRTEAIVHYNQSQVDLIAALGVLNQEALLPDQQSHTPNANESP